MSIIDEGRGGAGAGPEAAGAGGGPRGSRRTDPAQPPASQPLQITLHPGWTLASAVHVGLLVLWPYWLDLSHCAKSAPPYPPPLRSLVLWLWKAVTLCCQQGGRAHPHHA
jgi:hypothetical protein